MFAIVSLPGLTGLFLQSDPNDPFILEILTFFEDNKEVFFGNLKGVPGETAGIGARGIKGESGKVGAPGTDGMDGVDGRYGLPGTAGNKVTSIYIRFSPKQNEFVYIVGACR